MPTVEAARANTRAEPLFQLFATAETLTDILPPLPSDNLGDKIGAGQK